LKNTRKITMNHIHRSIWNDRTGTFVAVSEMARSAGKKISSCTAVAGAGGRFRLKVLAFSLLLVCGASVYAQPTGGVVTAGSATIGGTSGEMTITQTTSNVAINWQSFGIQAGQSVQFVQPGSSSVALNRVIGSDPSNILGSLSSNGKVFLVIPNGILFGHGASVNVGGLLASTMAISDADFMANNYTFSGAGAGSVVNQGSINAADGGYVALLGANVSNQGVIVARLGTVALAAGNAVTLDMAGDKLLNITVNQGALNALVENGGMIQADGGHVLMTTQAAGSLLANAVNNTGIIQAQTIQNVKGTIMLMGGMETGVVNVGGSLDASAPTGGDGGFIETSAAYVKIARGVKVTTEAPQGKTGTWLIDPQDFTIGSGTTDNITGADLSALLVTNSVTIRTATGVDADDAGTPPVSNLYTGNPGNGDIHVNEAIEWTASSSPTTLSLLADRDVNINAPISATNGNLFVCCGRDVNVKLGADITTVNGSVFLGAGNDIDLRGALSTTNGNVMMCAANDINIVGKLTLTHTTTIIPGQSLGLPLGLVLSAGYGASGPGVDGGTVTFSQQATVTNAPTTIIYNPVTYDAPTDYSLDIIGAAPTQKMLVFAQGEDKVFDGTTTATLSPLLMGSPDGVTLLAGFGSTANFNTPDVGTDKPITWTGYSLSGDDAGLYAFAVPCCDGTVARTTASITAETVVPPVTPPVTPPVVTPPVRPPVVRPPVVVPPQASPVDSPETSPVVVAPGASPIAPTQELGPFPPVWTPSTPPAVVRPEYVLTVLSPAPMPPSMLVVVAPPPPPPVFVPVVEPVVVPVEAPPAVYQPPVRKPRPERN
jgi:filamentous hemagglutinin family protein